MSLRQRDIYAIYGALAFVATFCIVLALIVGADHTKLTKAANTATATAGRLATEARQAKAQAHAACMRTREFGVPLGVFFEAHHVFDAKTQLDYITTIPARCP